MIKPFRRLAALFTLGLLVFYSPLLGTFNRPGSLLGLPILPLYLFVCWGALVAAAGALVLRGRP